jgi:hypothetical protein
MRKIRDVLRLKFGAELSLRQVSASLGIPFTTVSGYVKRAEAAGLGWPLPEDLDDDALEALLFTSTWAPSGPRQLPDFQKIHLELRRPHVTLMLLWHEYKETFPDGYAYSQFALLYRRWSRHLDVVMRQSHKAGEKLFVDFPGAQIPIYDQRSGAVGFSAELFVAVLGASSYIYAEATRSQELLFWVSAPGGVPPGARARWHGHALRGIARSVRREPRLLRGPDRPVLRPRALGALCRRPATFRVPGQRLHDVRGGPGLHRFRLRLEAHPTHQCPPLRQDAEMEAKGTDWWGAVWAERHLVGERVWRIEFEIGRAALSDLELSRPDDVLAAVPSLWRYCASEWLTLRDPTADSNRSRWPLDERWRAVQSASLVHGATELRFIRGHKRAQTLRRLVPALVGYLVSFAVVSGTNDIDDTLDALATQLRSDEAIRRVSFAQRVQQRRTEGSYR